MLDSQGAGEWPPDNNYFQAQMRETGMAEVVVTLSLTRKSGILAAAVSSLARNGLEFKSHRFVDADDDAGLKVELMADGEVEDSGTLSEALERIRGVDAVADIGVDGQSLLRGEPAEEEQPQPEPAVEAGSAVAADTEMLNASVAEPESDAEIQTESEILTAEDSETASADATSGKNSARRPMMRRRRRFT